MSEAGWSSLAEGLMNQTLCLGGSSSSQLGRERASPAGAAKQHQQRAQAERPRWVAEQRRNGLWATCHPPVPPDWATWHCPPPSSCLPAGKSVLCGVAYTAAPKLCVSGSLPCCPRGAAGSRQPLVPGDPCSSPKAAMATVPRSPRHQDHQWGNAAQQGWQLATLS